MDLFRGNKHALVAKEALEESGSEVSIAAPTIVELMRNACRSKDKREEHLIVELTKAVRVLPLDTESALRAGRIEAALIERGEIIDFADRLIGAIALEHHESLLTRNEKHFQRIGDLVVETY